MSNITTTKAIANPVGGHQRSQRLIELATDNWHMEFDMERYMFPRPLIMRRKLACNKNHEQLQIATWLKNISRIRYQQVFFKMEYAYLYTKYVNDSFRYAFIFR